MARLTEDDTALNQLNFVISLKELGITPQTIFFDFGKVTQAEIENVQQKSRARPYSVAETLLDATRALGESERRGSASLQPRPRRAMSNGNIRPRSTLGQDRAAEGSSNPSRATKSLSVPTVTLTGNSPEGPTPLGGSPEDSLIQFKHSLRNRSSMISLLNRGKDKAAPETGTVSATAFGEVDNMRDSQLIFDSDSIMQSESGRVTHSQVQNYGQYHNLMWQALDLQDADGQDPHVLKLLDNLFEENFPIEMLEFGPAVAPHSKRLPIKKSNGRPSGQTWRPDGSLVGHYGEHTGPCNRIVVAPDHAFFITASDDGTVKIWDTARLEKNVATRSRQTYKHAQGAKVKSLCFIENHHCFVSAATDGSVHVVRVDYSNVNIARYGKLKLVKAHQLPEGEYVVWMEHYKAGMRQPTPPERQASGTDGLQIQSPYFSW